MNPGDTFTHNGADYTVDQVLPNGKVLATVTTANAAPKKLVIHPNDITP